MVLLHPEYALTGNEDPQSIFDRYKERAERGLERGTFEGVYEAYTGMQTVLWLAGRQGKEAPEGARELLEQAEAQVWTTK
ncbi:TPA: hypothetical protein HA265_00030 [Candidatus Woesearchaeota archaeon]|nr:hypothetical protein [Candidatus Woesearchaeota archaeon]